jgi:hypothetical protein
MPEVRMPAPMTEAWLFAASTPDLAPAVLPLVRARVACPDTGSLLRVRLVVDPVGGQPAVVWCERFDQPPLACSRTCFVPEVPAAD